MEKREQIILIVIGVAFLGMALYYSSNSSTLVGQTAQDLAEQYGAIDWDKISPRDIVKTSIPVEILEQENNDCLVTAKYFDSIAQHSYFIRSHELIEKLQFNNDTKTLIMPCDELHGEKSRLNIWYITTDSNVFTERYEYFVTPWEDDTVLAPIPHP